MMMEEVYRQIGGDYAAALALLGRDKLIERFVRRFPADPTFGALTDAMQASDWDAAFAAAHTLKGLALSLAFTRLGHAAAALTEALRPPRSTPDPAAWLALYAQVKDCYQQVLEAVLAAEATAEAAVPVGVHD